MDGRYAFLLQSGRKGTVNGEGVKGETTSSFVYHKLVFRQMYFRIQVKDLEINFFKIMKLR